MADRYFSALELLDPPDWSTVGGFHPHVTLHYFGALPLSDVIAIKEALLYQSAIVWELVPKSIEKFGSGLAITFEPDHEWAVLNTVRAQLLRNQVLAPHVDMTYPDFIAHMSLPNFSVTPDMMRPLKFGGPVLLATKSVTVRA